MDAAQGGAMFWIYMLQCAEGSYYVGHTEDLEYRLGQHHAGTFVTCYTFQRRPLRLVFSQDFGTREEALEAERRIKGWSRAKKQALIAGNWGEINRLGRGKHRHQRTKPAA
jgi:predicted GIY-YIG superfamily endonuclease